MLNCKPSMSNSDGARNERRVEVGLKYSGSWVWFLISKWGHKIGALGASRR